MRAGANGERSCVPQLAFPRFKELAHHTSPRFAKDLESSGDDGPNVIGKIASGACVPTVGEIGKLSCADCELMCVDAYLAVVAGAKGRQSLTDGLGASAAGDIAGPSGIAGI